MEDQTISLQNRTGLFFVDRKGTSLLQRLVCAGLCIASCSFLACAPAPQTATRELPVVAYASPLSVPDRGFRPASAKAALENSLDENEKLRKEMEPDRQALELALYKAAGKANIASIDEIQVTVSAKNEFDVYTELTILQEDVKQAKWAAVTLYNTFVAVEGYQVSSYTFVVDTDQSTIGMISKTDADEKFNMTRRGVVTTFTAQELEQELTGTVSSGSSAAQEAPAQKQPAPAAQTPAASADRSWTAALDKNAPDTNEITGPLDRTAYWVPKGKSYHFSSNCTTLKRSKTILSGSLQQALSAGKADPCNLCAGGR